MDYNYWVLGFFVEREKEGGIREGGREGGGKKGWKD